MTGPANGVRRIRHAVRRGGRPHPAPASVRSAVRNRGTGRGPQGAAVSRGSRARDAAIRRAGSRALDPVSRGVGVCRRAWHGAAGGAPR